MNARLPAITPIGNPPPTTLPYDARSAWMPNRPWAPRGWARNPVTTSSKISSDRLEVGPPALHRLDHDRGQLVGALAQDLQRLRCSVIEHQHVVRRRRHDPG